MSKKRKLNNTFFAQVRRELAQEQQVAKQRGEYMFVTRRTVLGRMKQIKDAERQLYDTRDKEN